MIVLFAIKNVSNPFYTNNDVRTIHLFRVVPTEHDETRLTDQTIAQAVVTGTETAIRRFAGRVARSMALFFPEREITHNLSETPTLDASWMTISTRCKGAESVSVRNVSLSIAASSTVTAEVSPNTKANWISPGQAPVATPYELVTSCVPQFSLHGREIGIWRQVNG
jgi:hypothetical protein